MKDLIDCHQVLDTGLLEVMLPEPENLNHDSSHPAYETVGTAKPVGSQDPPRGPFVGEMRDLSPRELARSLRTALGLPPKDQGLAERAAGHQRHLPSLIRSVDVEAWLAWALAGLPLFAERLPSFRQARDAGTRVLLLVALTRANGNISAVARSLRSSRKVVRDNMRRLGLHPWRRAGEFGSGHDAEEARV